MTESQRGASIPPPPPWVAAPSPAEPADQPGPTPPAAVAATEVLTARPDAGSKAETVTVSSAPQASPGASTPIVMAGPRVPSSRGKRSLVIVAVALGLVIVTAITLAVIPHGSTDANTMPVSDPQAQVADEQSPPSEEPQPTTPPSTAPPTTQALPPAQVVRRITTTDPVVFITIDDGWHLPPEATAQLMSSTVPITTFLLSQVLDKDPAMWKGLDQAAGSIENHSISHPAFAKLSLEQQRGQICTASEHIAATVGRFPTMFRPPYGSVNANTAVAAGACGIKYVVMWGASVNDGKIAFASGSALRPGDIVLLHYRPELAGDLAAVLAAAQAAGLKPAHLTDYLK